MIESFVQYIAKHKLCRASDEILLAISGGVDSVVLLDLFHKANFNVSIAHCNFQLRGNDSDQDELYVKELSEKYKVPLYIKRFDTISYAENSKVSIEMAARDLRYSWFNEILNKNNLHYIATGHHLNDSIETFFLNLARGTGINGLSGIKNKNGNIIRPLLFAYRQQIESYAKIELLNYRYDVSNDSMKYMRNIVRKQILPLFHKINPSFSDVMVKNIDNLYATADIYNHNIKIIRDKILKKKKNSFFILINDIKLNNLSANILFEIFKEFNFNKANVDDIILNLNTISGKTFFSSTHKLLIDRDRIIIEPLIKELPYFFSAKNIDEFGNSKIFKSVKLIDSKDFKMNSDKLTACIDADKITFPIVIRKWKKGDSFKPLGMSKNKKLSDFFIDEKINRFTKSKILILESGNRIIWIIGHRIDNRFKITKFTKRVIVINANDYISQ